MFDDITLSDLELAESLWEDASARSPGKALDGWAPRIAGKPLDRTTDRYRAEALAASFGIPDFDRMHWLQAQLFDRGESAVRGHVRLRIKFAFCDAPLIHCTKAGIRAMRRVRRCSLSTPSNFLINCRKKKAEDGSSGVTPEAWVIARRIAAMAKESDAVNGDAAPSSMCGSISCVFEGTQTYSGQYCLLTWRRCGDAWLPSATVTQFSDPSGGWDVRTVDMTAPPPFNLDGRRRNPAASHYVGSQVSHALQARIDHASEIKSKGRIKMRTV